MERTRLQEFFRSHLAAVRATPGADYTEQMRKLLDYCRWWRFTISFRRGPDQPYETLTSKAHGSLSGGRRQSACTCLWDGSAPHKMLVAPWLNRTASPRRHFRHLT